MAQVKKLNRQQQKAVEYTRGPLLIIAGAGTGKTTVITEKIKYLIKKGLAKPQQILALTFTEKAAKEMEERVDKDLPYGYTQMWIGTFHSFCDRVLRRDGYHIGLDTNYKLFTQAESTQFVRDNIFEFDLDYFRPFGNPTKFIDGMLTHFSRLGDEDVNPQQYLQWVKSKTWTTKSELKNEEQKQEIKKWKELSKAYSRYSELKSSRGYLDFSDLIGKTLELFRRRKNILSDYRRQFKYILVDEFQDTNVAQYELIKLFSPGKKAKLTVVGDDSQSIYKFRGAAVSNIIFFKKDYESAKTILLTDNYRSTQKILDSAYQLIQNNNPDTLEVKLGISKNLIGIKSPKDGGDDIVFIHKSRVENEAEEVVKVIARLVKEEKYNCKDVAILVRANNHAEAFVSALQRHSIPYQFLGPGRLFKQSEIIDLVSYLNVLYDLDNSLSMYRLLSMDEFDINPRDLVRISSYAKRRNVSIFEACNRLDEVYVGEKTRNMVGRIIAVVDKHLKLAKKISAGQILYFFMEEFDIVKKLLNPDNPQAQRKAANISRFFDKLKTYEVDHETADVRSVVDWIELSSQLGESPLAADTDWTRENAVNILTVHSAKGLEFPVVFLVNLVGQRFPTIDRREQIPITDDLVKEVLPEGDAHLQEERRLFYVGMTRAMKRLYLTAADYYGEAKREKKLSPFIFEALGDKAIASQRDEKAGQQLSFLDYKSAMTEKQIPATIDSLHIDYLSYSQIDTFNICPLHYKLRYIYKIPIPPSPSLSFGSTIHAVLRDFYNNVKNGKKPTKTLIYRLLDKNWIALGYTDKTHEKKAKHKAKKQLTDFYEKVFNPKILPIVIEDSFTLNLPQRGNYPKLKIGGRIDRVDRLEKNQIEIVDYKTGSRFPTQKEIDQDLQLTIYGLAAVYGNQPWYGRKPQDISLSLFYIDGLKKITTRRNIHQLDQAIEDIYQIRDKIEASDFKCSGNRLCENCEFAMYCREDDQ